MLTVVLVVILAALLVAVVLFAVDQHNAALRISDIHLREHEKTRTEIDTVARTVERLNDRLGGL